MHLGAAEADLDAEVARIQTAGGVGLTSEPVAEHGWRWQVLTDPDGNALWVLQLPSEEGRSSSV